MKLISAINQKLEPHNLHVQLGLNVGDDKIRYGKNAIYWDKGDNRCINPVFQLVEKNKVLFQDTDWDSFMVKLRKEFGARFMRENQLSELCSEDRSKDMEE